MTLYILAPALCLEKLCANDRRNENFFISSPPLADLSVLEPAFLLLQEFAAALLCTCCLLWQGMLPVSPSSGHWGTELCSFYGVLAGQGSNSTSSSILSQ